MLVASGIGRGVIAGASSSRTRAVNPALPAVPTMHDAASSAVSAGLRSKASAAIPATIGAAIDVPDAAMWSPHARSGKQTSWSRRVVALMRPSVGEPSVATPPGAATSMPGPKFEKLARWPLPLTAATVMTFARSAESPQALKGVDAQLLPAAIVHRTSRPKPTKIRRKSSRSTAARARSRSASAASAQPSSSS